MPSSAVRGRGQRLLGLHALFERDLALFLQRLHRRVAIGQLRGQFTQARVELPPLAAHAVQRLGQRGDLRALRFQRQGQRMCRVARFARGIAGLVAGLGQRAALRLELLAGVLQRAHPLDRLFLPCAGFAALFAAAVQRLRQRRQLGFDLLDAPARRIQPALLALQLAGQLGHAAVRHVQAALRVLALLLGRQQAVAQLGQGRFEFALARLQRFDRAAQRLDLALAQQRALLGVTGAQHLRASPRPSARHCG